MHRNRRNKRKRSLDPFAQPRARDSDNDDDDGHSSSQHSNTANQNPPTPDNTTSTSYVYRDYAQEEDPTEKILNAHAGHFSSIIPHDEETASNLASQKLPSKLGAMLSDPDLVNCVTWMPHGRSWKVFNRDLFSSYALPRYFGHTNHASFVRLVNAWGFRRITSGPDRDSYYHELFLRGKRNLHCRMTRLPDAQRKTPVTKENKSPDFYEIAKNSPLPENTWQYKPHTMNNVGAARMGQSLAPAPTPFAGGMSMFGAGMLPGAAMEMRPGINHGHGGSSSSSGRLDAVALASNPTMGGTLGSGGGLSGRPTDRGTAGGESVDSSSSSQNTQKLLAAAAALGQQYTNTSNASILQSLITQNHLLRALLANSEAAVDRLRTESEGGGEREGTAAAAAAGYPNQQQNRSSNQLGGVGGTASTATGEFASGGGESNDNDNDEDACRVDSK